MNQKLENTQRSSQRASNYDLYLSLLVKRENALNVIKSAKSQFLKRDKYKQVCKLNKQIEELRRKLKL